MAYENEAILAHQNGEEFDYIIPETTMLIENPGAVLIDADPKAEEWLDFVLSADGQRQFALKGFRPVDRRRRVRRGRGRQRPVRPVPRGHEPADRRGGLRELERAVRQVLRRGDGHRHPDHRRLREGRVTSTAIAAGAGRRARAGRPGRPPGRAHPRLGRRPRRGDDLVQPARPDPARRRRGHGHRGRVDRVLATRSPTSRPRPPSGSPSAGRCSSPRSTSSWAR